MAVCFTMISVVSPFLVDDKVLNNEPFILLHTYAQLQNVVYLYLSF